MRFAFLHHFFGYSRAQRRRGRFSPEAGFTLVEVLLYAALLALFIGATLAFTSSILGTADKLLEQNELIANQDLVTAKAQWIINQASAVSSPAPNSSAEELVVEGSDAAIFPATFRLVNNQIMLSVAQGDFVPLTNNRVNVTFFEVRHFTNAQSTSTLRVALRLTSAIYPNVLSSTTLSYSLLQ